MSSDVVSALAYFNDYGSRQSFILVVDWNLIIMIVIVVTAVGYDYCKPSISIFRTVMRE